MISLVETGLMNAVLAVGLALPVLILGRLWHRPALVHAFWILVLIKLVSPPLYQVNIAWHSTAPAASNPTPQVRTLGHVDGGVGQSQAGQTAVIVPSPSPWEAAFTNAAANCWRGMAVGLGFLQNLAIPALWFSLIGSICWFSWQGWRVVRFAQVFLRSAQIGPESLQRQAQTLARQMGLRQAPEVWLLPAVVSPMLWCVGGQPRILFPSALLSRLDECAVATLLTHELAHFRRGDYRVRMLEFLASGLFWWHPIVWLARRELEISEEQCCDAWVVSQFPASQRRYADALLATVDFLSEEHPPVPALASGLGDVPMLRQRLKLIMSGTVPKSLSFVGRLAVILTAMLIPISPSLRARTTDRPGAKQPVVIASSPDSQTRNLETVQAQATRLKQEIDVLSHSVAISSAKRSAAGLPVEVLTEIQSTPGTSRSQSTVATARRETPTNTPAGDRVEPHIWARAISPNGLSRIVAWTSGVIEWQRTDQPHLKIDLSPYRISTILYSANGDVFLSGCRDGIVRVWDAATCKLLSRLEGHQGSVRALALAPNGKCLATADQHGLVLLWSFNGHSESKTLTKTCSAVNSLAFSADGQTLALGTGSWLSTDPAQVQVWDLCTESLLNCLDHDSALAVVRLSTDGKSVSGAEWNGTLLTWDLESSALVSKRQVNRLAIPATAFAPQI